MAAVHGIVSTVSIEERGDSLRRVIDSKCPWSNHLSCRVKLEVEKNLAVLAAGLSKLGE
jgi:uncharacterized OsmC-like protein